jgi:hypothetical protein
MWPTVWVLRVLVEASWNVMAHAQKLDFVFRRNGRVHLNRRGRQFSRLLAAEVCPSAFIVGSNAGFTMFRGSEKGTGYPLHSPVSPSLPLSCVTVCHHISSGVYCKFLTPRTVQLTRKIFSNCITGRFLEVVPVTPWRRKRGVEL